MSKRIDWDQEVVLVFQMLLALQGGGWVSVAALAQACARNTRHVRKVIAIIRDCVPEIPVLSSKNGYRITGEPVANEIYRHLKMATILTHFRRWKTGSGEPYFRKLELVNPAQAAWLRQQADQFQANLELALQTKLD